ncbi:MAG: hypothetical protein WCK35_12075, partial [Chloroflexota bacterium]
VDTIPAMIGLVICGRNIYEILLALVDEIIVKSNRSVTPNNDCRKSDGNQACKQKSQTELLG